jgi:hypothetical protein
MGTLASFLARQKNLFCRFAGKLALAREAFTCPFSSDGNSFCEMSAIMSARAWQVLMIYDCLFK